MLKNLILLASALTSLLISNVALAQDSAPSSIKLPNVGVGTRLDMLFLNFNVLGALGGDSTAASIYVPIDVSPMFRVEPFFSHVSTSTSVEGSAGVTSERSESATTIGAGLFYTFGITGSSRGYVGGRLGLDFAAEDRLIADESTSADSTSLLIEPTLGAEYYFATAWSVGADVSLNINTLLSEESTPDDDADDGRTIINTSSGLFLRFYLL